MKSNQSRTTDFAELRQVSRISYGHFLSQRKWGEKEVCKNQQEGAFQKLAGLAIAKQAVLYLSIDGKRAAFARRHFMGG